MSAEEFPYLDPVIRESGDDDTVLQEILHLADEGLSEHGDTISRVCSQPSGAASDTLVTATHRLANVTAALRLEPITRELNRLEALARQEQMAEFCASWRDLSEKIAALHEEVRRAQRD
ncbi:MAG: hypothetical protein PF508_09795 [Spirochaeta sp.]|jgi:HPt (histidine-containing phosphotransfer) domain-containing protein|nr:hypothetical protein [Spirochaeta sp.]